MKLLDSKSMGRGQCQGGNRVTVKEVAHRLEVSSATVYSLIGAGRLRCYRIGAGRGVIRVGEEHLSEFLKGAEPKQEMPAPPRAKLKHLRL